MSTKKRKPANPSIACGRDGAAFWLTEEQLDTVFEAMEVARNLQASYLSGSVMSEPDDDQAETMFDPCEKFALFHRVLVDLKERRGE